MTNTNLLSASNLASLSADQLANAFGFYNRKAHDARSASACSRAMNSRERVANEVARRGLVVRSNRHYSDPISVEATHYMVGSVSDFEAIR